MRELVQVHHVGVSRSFAVVPQHSHVIGIVSQNELRLGNDRICLSKSVLREIRDQSFFGSWKYFSLIAVQSCLALMQYSEFAPLGRLGPLLIGGRQLADRH